VRCDLTMPILGSLGVHAANAEGPSAPARLADPRDGL
jgi:hypothetical protein